MKTAVPLLAQALAAKFRVLASAAPDAPVEDALMSAVAALDAADRAYRAAIADILGPAEARTVLETMAAYRSRAASIRETARAELDALYGRAGRSYGAFDPLDAYVPSPAGLSHLDGVRAADLADRAKAEALAVRGEANARIGAAVTGHVADLVAAKRVRNTAFAGALHAAVVPLSGGGPVGPVVEALTALADGWY